jgi:ABC-type antimicrobial peptide transport system permease subunit
MKKKETTFEIVFELLFLLIMFILGIIASVLFVVFIGLQLSGNVNWSFEILFSPLIFYFSLLILIAWFYLIFINFFKKNNSSRTNFTLSRKDSEMNYDLVSVRDSRSFPPYKK